MAFSAKLRRRAAPVRIFLTGLILGMTLVVLPLSSAEPVAAAGLLPTPTGRCPKDYAAGTISSCKQSICPDTGKPCDYSLDDFKSLIAIIGNLILGITGSAVLLLFIYGGLVWMTAAGDSGKITKGKDILVGSTVGLIIIFGAVTIVRITLQTVGVQPEIIQEVEKGFKPQTNLPSAPGAGGAGAAPSTFCCITSLQVLGDIPLTQNCPGGILPKSQEFQCANVVCCQHIIGPAEPQKFDACTADGGTPIPFSSGLNTTPCK